MNSQRPLLASVADSAHLLGVSPRTIIRLISQGCLQSVKVRRRRMVRMDSLIAFAGKGTDLDTYKRVLSGR